MVKKWIQSALKNHSRGALHRQLGIRTGMKIPISLLQEINNTQIGSMIDLPQESYATKIIITPLLKKRANLALNLRRSR